MSAIDTIASEWERARRGSLEFIDSIPEEHLSFRPSPESMTFAEQYLHVAEANYIFGAAACGRENPNTVKDAEAKAVLKATRAALRGFVCASYDFIVNSVRQMEPASTEESATFFGQAMPRQLILAKALEHHAHHRGQTAVYFRINRLNPPSERLF